MGGQSQVPMDELAVPLPGRLVSDAALEREFEERLPETCALAFRVAYGVLRRREDAEDVAQDAAVRAFQRLGSLKNRERFRGWLVRIAWRLAMDRRRSERRREAREQVVSSAPSPAWTAEDLAAGRQTEDRVWRALETLPDKLRIVVVLSAIKGHGAREVAELLQVPEGTVKSRLHDARRRLLEILR